MLFIDRVWVRSDTPTQRGKASGGRVPHLIRRPKAAAAQQAHAQYYPSHPKMSAPSSRKEREEHWRKVVSFAPWIPPSVVAHPLTHAPRAVSRRATGACSTPRMTAVAAYYL
jgi:hypothetical protein